MMAARTKSKTVKKKPATSKKKPAPKKKPTVKKSPPKPLSKPDKKKLVKPEARPAKPDAKKTAAAKAAAPSARDLAYAQNANRFAAQETRAKKAPKVRPSRTREPGKRPDLPLPTPVERPAGASGQLGEKYVCFSCGAKFYDLGKPEPRCPKCGADQREAPRQTRQRPAPAAAEPDVVEERPVKRSRLLDEDEDEIVVDTEVDADAAVDLDLGLGVVDEGEDFGPDEAEEEEEPEEP
jgi:hypothetical protein